MYKWILFFFIFLIAPTTLFAATRDSDYHLFYRIFSEWTASFNQKDWLGSCRLFSKSLIADYQGYPPKNYSSLCNGFKKIFSEKNRRYHYRFMLHHVYRSGDLAIARITWYLDIDENGKRISTTQDEGIDVFKKMNSGRWKIVNYLGYPVQQV